MVSDNSTLNWAVVSPKLSTGFGNTPENKVVWDRTVHIINFWLKCLVFSTLFSPFYPNICTRRTILFFINTKCRKQSNWLTYICFFYIFPPPLFIPIFVHVQFFFSSIPNVASNLIDLHIFVFSTYFCPFYPKFCTRRTIFLSINTKCRKQCCLVLFIILYHSASIYFAKTSHRPDLPVPFARYVRPLVSVLRSGWVYGCVLGDAGDAQTTPLVGHTASNPGTNSQVDKWTMLPPAVFTHSIYSITEVRGLTLDDDHSSRYDYLVTSLRSGQPWRSTTDWLRCIASLKLLNMVALY